MKKKHTFQAISPRDFMKYAKKDDIAAKLDKELQASGVLDELAQQRHERLQAMSRNSGKLF